MVTASVSAIHGPSSRDRTNRPENLSVVVESRLPRRKIEHPVRWSGQAWLHDGSGRDGPTRCSVRRESARIAGPRGSDRCLAAILRCGAEVRGGGTEIKGEGRLKDSLRCFLLLGSVDAGCPGSCLPALLP